MKVGVLTSSRADYSIYFPLLKALHDQPDFALEILAFGTHVSHGHGYTIQQIKNDGFAVAKALETVLKDDSPAGITRSMAKTMQAFAEVWPNSDYDIVFCLGDRYEMFAACASAVPFNIRLAHIHGGEQTLGAIDDAFRHSITHMASYHFVAAKPYYERVVSMKGSESGVYNVGALSIDNLKNLPLLSLSEFKERFKIDLSVPTVLITVHPETVSYEKNEIFIEEIIAALDSIHGYQYVITMPNADTMGKLIRSKLEEFVMRTSHSVAIESFGTIGYLSCMKHCSFMLGNTSSGFIEASFFPKYVVNLGDRQRGRIITENIAQCPIERNEIIRAVENFKNFSFLKKIDLYGDGKAAYRIVETLKTIAT